jgi:hypothetical protein
VSCSRLNFSMLGSNFRVLAVPSTRLLCGTTWKISTLQTFDLTLRLGELNSIFISSGINMLSGACVLSSSSRARRSRWTASLKSLARDTGTVTLEDCTAVLVGFFLRMVTQGLPPPLAIVHATAYSLLLLNTDLHVADLTTRMSRGQFVKNTMTTIQMQIRSNPPGALSSSDLTYDDCSSSVRTPGSDDTETIPRSKRSDSITSWNSVSRDVSPQPATLSTQANSSTPSVQVSMANDPRSAPHHVYGRGWEEDMENLLKVNPP